MFVICYNSPKDKTCIHLLKKCIHLLETCFDKTVSHEISASWNFYGFQQYDIKPDFINQELVQGEVLW